MDFISTIFDLAERVLQAFTDLGKFFTNGRFLDRILETLDQYTGTGSLIDIFANVIQWVLQHLSPELLDLSFAELLLVTGVPIIIVFSFCSWLLKTIPIL